MAVKSTVIVLLCLLVCLLFLLPAHFALVTCNQDLVVYRTNQSMYGTRLQLPAPMQTRHQFPKQVWTFWNDDHPPVLVQKCQRKMRQQLEPYGFQVNLLNMGNMSRYVPVHHVNFINQLIGNVKHKVTRFSDWLRMYLLYMYGGLWLDASFIVNSGASVVEALQGVMQGKQDAFMFNNPRHKRARNQKVYETFFIASAPQSQLMHAWYNEFVKAHFMGAKAYLRHSFFKGRLMPSVMMMNPYFVVYTCLNNVLIDLGSDTFELGTDSVNKHVYFSGLPQIIITHPEVTKKLPFIKLTRKCRDYLDKQQVASWAYLFQ